MKYDVLEVLCSKPFTLMHGGLPFAAERAALSRDAA